MGKSFFFVISIRYSNHKTMERLVFLLLFFITSILLTGCKPSADSEVELIKKSGPRTKIPFDFGWKFFRGDIKNAGVPGFDDSSWRKLDLPHDWSIEDLPGTNSPFDSMAIGGIDAGYLVGGTGWYRKEFEVPKRLKNNRLFIDFEGVYMDADVWLNGAHLGNHPYGYTEFGYDISDKVRLNEKNILAVRVRNEGRNSRWYSGSGIYRHVWVSVTDPVYFEKWGTKITTPQVNNDSALVFVHSSVMNKGSEEKTLKILTALYDKEGEFVKKEESEITVGAGGSSEISQEIFVTNPKLWSPDSPSLYSAKIIIFEKSEKIDEIKTAFGIRKLEFSVEKGFLLNGVPTKLKGGCMHHDNGPLGSAAFDRAEERRVELMKASGFNAIRTSHNPPSPAFLDACDRLGMLVIDEAFDMWKFPKNEQDYHQWFDEWWQRDIDAMVKRDWNHPSVIMWSTGNEIPESGNPEGVPTSAKLAGYVRSLDPTRPVTAAVNGLNPGKDPYFATLDITGYNYSFGGDHGQQSIFDVDQTRVPGRISVCTESYPLEAFGAWVDVMDHSWVLGDFVWTGFDYLGEASIGWLGYPHDSNFYPWNHAFCGDLNICGEKRPQSFYRDVLWQTGKQLSVFVKPPVPSFPGQVHRISWSKWFWQDVAPEWNWEGFDGDPLEVEVYCGYELVELFLNNISLGKKETNRGNQWIARWNVPYQPGELKAVAYTGPEVVATAVLKTAEKPVKIVLTADWQNLKADGQDLSFISVELTDMKGLVHPGAENLISFELAGPGEIIAVASSNPKSTESFKAHSRKVWKGKCLLIVKTSKVPGEITLTATSDGLESAFVNLISK